MDDNEPQQPDPSPNKQADEHADETPQQPASEPPQQDIPEPQPVPVVGSGSSRSRKKIVLICLAIIILLAGGASGWYFMHKKTAKPSPAPTATSKTNSKAAVIPTISSSDVKLDTTKNYGNKYANGILPLGDNKYVTSGPKQGYVYLCHPPQAGAVGGAQARGPWFTNNNTSYDINKKVHVSGSVSWQSNYNMAVQNGMRVIATNDLPHDHTTGTFPVATTDPAYQYDRNPNSIGGQSLTYTLAANPTVQSPSCMGGESGIMTTGIALFNGFDAGGRDAGAWEVQDGCGGHPQKTHEYHYHTLSSCIKDTNVQTVIGYALDGFPITGPKVGANNILTTSDLDECHGITSAIQLDGKQVISYHYVMTQDFPYSVSCFKAKAIQAPGIEQP